MNIERLQKVIEANEAVPDERFEMDTLMRKSHCGTVGCAVGNYVMANPDCKLVINDPGDLLADLAAIDVTAGIGEGFDLCASHFEINYEDALFLFSFEEYHNPTRQNVIARIREFIESHNNPDPRTVPKDRISLAGAVHPAGEL